MDGGRGGHSDGPPKRGGGAPGQGAGSREAGPSGAHAGASSADPNPWPMDVKVDKHYTHIRIKGQGLGDDLHRSNEEVREAIKTMSADLGLQQSLELRAAESEAELADALKLYRDMNHLSLAGGITCEQVIHHVQSHTVVLYYGGQEDEQEPILVTAATFSMRNQTMMLRLLATHPRMTRKGFGRVTVHFLKELCRNLRKTDILVYTYPSSSPFYKALHFRHTNPGLQKPAAPAAAAPAAELDSGASEAAAAAAAAREREASRDARRVFSAKENEMICHIQSTMEQVLEESLKAVSAHPYACTRRRASAGKAPAASPAAAPAAAAAPSSAAAQRQAAQSSSSREKKAPQQQQSQQQQSLSQHPQLSPYERPQKQPRPPPRERVIAPPRERLSKAIGLPLVGPGGVPANGAQARRSRAAERGEQSSSGRGRANGGDASRDEEEGEPSEDTAEVDYDDDGPAENGGEHGRGKRRLEKDEYQVERIVGVRNNGGELQYLIKWKGWQSKHNTWEPLHHLKNLQSEIDAFEGSLKAAKFS